MYYHIRTCDGSWWMTVGFFIEHRRVFMPYITCCEEIPYEVKTQIKSWDKCMCFRIRLKSIIAAYLKRVDLILKLVCLYDIYAEPYMTFMLSHICTSWSNSKALLCACKVLSTQFPMAFINMFPTTKENKSKCTCGVVYLDLVIPKWKLFVSPYTFYF